MSFELAATFVCLFLSRPQYVYYFEFNRLLRFLVSLLPDRIRRQLDLKKHCRNTILVGKTRTIYNIRGFHLSWSGFAHSGLQKKKTTNSDMEVRSERVPYGGRWLFFLWKNILIYIVYSLVVVPVCLRQRNLILNFLLRCIISSLHHGWRDICRSRNYCI